MMLTAWPDGGSAWFCCPCEEYRYRLTRSGLLSGQAGGAAVTFVMLNPSTADAQRDDATIRRCRGYARSWGFNRLVVVNLYGLRSTDPAGLWGHPDPVGPHNDEHVAEAAESAARDGSPLVAAWGAHARPDRVAQVLALPHMDRLTALGTTASGAPRHPLRLRSDVVPEPYQPRLGGA